VALLSETERGTLTREHPEWQVAGEEVSRQFEFADFNEAMEFVTRVADAAEKSDHHPDIDIRWNKVKLVLSTHSEGGLTSKDADMVEAIDGLI
jgi:4a-hydroxytetrahydrobiopterin dehydratase